MNKQEFLIQLRKGLSSLPSDEVEEQIGFYSEMIDDLTEEGLTEDEAVSKIGNIDEIVSQFIPTAPKAEKRKLKAWEIVLLVLGSPLWLSILIVFLSVILSLYIILWSGVIALWAIDVSFIGSAAGFVICGTAFCFTGNSFAGTFLIGSGLVLLGLSIFILFGCKAATKGATWIMNKSIRLKNKEALQ